MYYLETVNKSKDYYYYFERNNVNICIYRMLIYSRNTIGEFTIKSKFIKILVRFLINNIL